MGAPQAGSPAPTRGSHTRQHRQVSGGRDELDGSVELYYLRPIPGATMAGASGGSSPLSGSVSAPVISTYNRSRVEMTVAISPRMRPPTEMRIQRLEKNLRPPSSKISSQVRYANDAMLLQLQSLAQIDRTYEPSEQDAAPRTKLPPIHGRSSGPQSTAIVNDITAMLKESSDLYAGGQRRLAPVPKKEEEEAKKPKPKARGAPSGTKPPKAESRISSRSEATLYVRTMLAELRQDEQKRQDFESKCAQILEEQGRNGMSEKIKANAMATRLGGEAYLEAVRQKRESLLAKQLERARQVSEQRALLDEAKLANSTERTLKWEKEREERLRRERREEVLRRKLAWAGVVMLISRTTQMGKVLVATRHRKIELKEKIASAKRLAICWKMYIFKKRLKALHKARMLIRPLIFWWRFHNRIRRKRAASAVLVDYLTARAKVSKFCSQTRKYVFAVRKLQASWKETWHLIRMQLDICSMWWILADEKRGMTHTAAVHLEHRERKERREVLRQDLRERKAAHMIKLIKWKKERREYDAWVEERKVYQEARQMFAVAAGEEPSKAVGKGTGGKPERTPPPRPIFTLFGPVGHFRQLQEKMAIKREADKRKAEREWAKQDSMRMEQELEAMGAKQAAAAAIPGRGGLERHGSQRSVQTLTTIPADAVEVV